MNEYTDIVRDQQEEELRGSMYAGVRAEPDTEAKIQALAKRTGLPADVVRLKQPDVELHDRLQSFDYEQVIKESPKLSSWLADPANASVAHDDWEGLSRTEKLLTYGRDYAGAVGQGVIGQGAGTTLSGLSELNAAAGRSLGSAITAGAGLFGKSAEEATRNFLSAPVIPWWLSPTGILREPSTELKQAGEAMAPPKERQTLGTDVAAGVGQLGFQIAGALLSGGASTTTSTGMLFAQGADIMAEKTAKDDADPAARDTAILMGGTITALTERYGLDKILSRVPPEVKNRTLRFIADKVAAGGIEAGQEFTEGLMHDVTRRLTTNEDAPMLENIEREMSAAAIAAAVVRSALGVRGFRTAQQNEQFFKALGEDASKSKLRERLPDRYRELIDRYTADGPVQQVMVPADKFSEYFQSVGLDPAIVASESGAQNYAEALASGGDVVIPMADFVAKIAPSDHLQGLMSDLRLAPDEMTMREAQFAEARMGDIEKELRAEMEQIDAAAKSGQALDTAIQRVITDVEGQLLARYDQQTARTMATAMRGMAVLANRANPDADPLEAAQNLWAKYGLTVQANPLPKVLTDARDFDATIDPMLDRLRRGEVPTDREQYGPSLFDFLREKGGIRDDGGELRARDLEAVDKMERKAGQRRLVSKEGLDFDRARELALEAGYDVGEEINTFLDALDREIGGQPVFSQRNENPELVNIAGGLQGLDKALREMGIDLSEDNAAIKRRLMGDGGQEFEQGENTDAFKQWSHGNDLIRLGEQHKFKTGEGVVVEVLHGTTGDFTEFDQTRANPESDMGAGFYFTNNKADVGENYAGLGPDLTNKVQLTAERIAADTDREYDDPDVIAEARAEFMANEGVTMPVFVRFDNPLVIGGKGETRFTYELIEDENGDIQDEQGTLVDFIVALRNVADQYDDGSVDGVVDSLLEYGDGVSASRLVEIIRGDEQFSHYTDDNGALVSTEIMRQAFEAAGFDGIIDQTVNQKFGSEKRIGKPMVGMDKNTVHFIAFQPEQIKSSIGNRGTFSETDPNILNQDKRGSIQIAPNRQMKISLFEKADLSTFLHETGHFYLEVLGDLAEANGTSQQVKDDYAKILKFLGVKNRSEVEVKHHEKWARANEAYLMEGKAPSTELQAVFQRFRAWLKLVYRQLSALDVELTNEVREVFGRIYATDAEIARAESEADLKDLFMDAKSAGMTEAEFALYREAIAEKSADAKDKLQTELMRVQRLKREAWWKDELAKTADEVAAEFDAQPSAQAFQRMQDGERMSRAQLVERYGEDVLKRLPKSKKAVYAKDGADIDSLAEVMGFQNADDMITALVKMPKRAEYVAAEADRRMMERYGDILNDVSLADEAMAALHNSQREKVLKIELRALNKKIREVEPFVKAERQKARANRSAAIAATEAGSAEASRRIAQGLVAQKQVRDLNPNQYLVAQRKANRLAFDAMAKGDYAEAGIQKQRELLNHYLYLEASKARAETDKIVKYLRGFTTDKKRGELGKAGADYLDQIDGILERYELKPATLKQMQRRESLAAWLDAQEAEGNAVAVPAEIQDDARRVNWRQAQVEELRAVRDAVKNIAHLASMKNKLIRKGKAIEFDGVVSELLDAIDTSGLALTDELERPNDKGAGIAERLAKRGRWVDGQLIKIEQIVEWLDGGKVDGPWARYFFDLADHAQSLEYDLHTLVTTKIEQISRKMPKDWRSGLMDGTSVRLPGFAQPMTRYSLLSIAFNMGNAQNIQRLQDGYGWSDADLQSVRESLTAKDWQFVQDVWDTLELMWPHMAQLEERMSGLPPEKVEAAPFEAAGLSLRGGYFPLAYDPRRSNAGEKQANEIETVQSFVAHGYGRANTNRGATKARLETFKAPVMLDFEKVIAGHMMKVIKDISHREAVIGINKILAHPQIKQGLIGHIGEARYLQMREWLQTLVVDNSRTIGGVAFGANLLMKARTNTAIVTMGWKISTMMAQFAGFTPVLDLVKPRHLTKAVLQSATSPRETWAMITSKSGEMRNRSNTIERDMKDSLMRLRGETSMLADVRRSAFFLTMIADRMVSMPAWLGGYEQALAEGKSEEDAVRAGDRAVRLSQGAGGAKDMAAVQRNNELMKLLTMYYTPFSVLYARLRDIGHQQALQGIGYLPKAVARFTALVILPAVISELLAGRGPEDDEDEAWWAARKIALYPLATVPVVRDMSGFLESGIIEVSGEGVMKYPPGFKLSPVVGAIEKAARAPGKIYDAATGEKDVDEVAWDLFETSGYVLGLPTAQPRITGEYLTDLLSGEADPENAPELMHDVLFRRQK